MDIDRRRGVGSCEWGVENGEEFISTPDRSQTPKFLYEEREKFDGNEVYKGASNQKVSIESLNLSVGFPDSRLLTPYLSKMLPSSDSNRIYFDVGLTYRYIDTAAH